MDTSLIIGKLLKREPLFRNHPIPKVPRYAGTESEFGVECHYDEDDRKVHEYIRESGLPVVFPNGGEAYIDCGHLEYCTPECSNPASLVAYLEAGKKLCWERRYSNELRCHNNTWHGNTFAAHENYYQCAKPEHWIQLSPFLVARTIIEGAGWYLKRGEFRISQRACFIREPVSFGTTEGRGLINTRGVEETLGSQEDWLRLHLICGDANMCETSAFLKYGLTSMVIEMLEMNALPRIGYSDPRAALKDLHELSAERSGWRLRGLSRGPKAAVDVLGMYVNRARELFGRRDEVTDIVLVVAEYVIGLLAADPMKLAFVLDWPTKLWLLREFEGSVKDPSDDWLRSQDMEYHDLDPDKGLYLEMRAKGMVARIVSDELISDSMAKPPEDTRAFIRGVAVQMLEPLSSRLVVRPGLWQKLLILEKSSPSVRPATTLRGCIYPKDAVRFEHAIGIPGETYGCLIPEIEKAICR